MKLKFTGTLKPIILTLIVTVAMLFLFVLNGIGSNNAHTVHTDFHEFLLMIKGEDSVLIVAKGDQSKDKVYRIQVCASRFKLTDFRIRLLEKQCGLSNLGLEQVDGYFKYLTPVSSDYKSVLKTLHELKAKSGFEGSFIVVYKEGARITTQTSKVNKRIPISASVQESVAAGKVLPQVVSVDTMVPKTMNQISNLDTSIKTDSSLERKIAKDSVESPVSYKSGFTNKFNIPNLVIFFLILFSIGFLVLGLFMILNVFRKMEKSEESIVIGELYAEQLAVYLNDKRENTPVPDLINAVSTNFQKDILLSEIIEFYALLPSEAGNKIRNLYFQLELDYYSFLKLSNEKWNVQARGIYELSAMDAQNEADSISEFINHPHPVIRHEAIAASVKLFPEDPFGFLDRLRVPLTKRDQINAYTLLWKQQYAIPDFSRWFGSTNPSVVQFAVEMVSMNRQVESVAGFDQLLYHSHEGVRESVIKAIGDLYLIRYSARLIAQFDQEHEPIQLAILQTIEKLQDPEMLNFLSDIILLNPFMKIRMAAAKALANISPQGLDRMKTLLLKEDHNITSIYNQIIQS